MDVFYGIFLLCCGSGIIDPVPVSPMTQDPGWVKSQDPDEQPESDFRELTNLFFS
jgi:hypothetical protein